MNKKVFEYLRKVLDYTYFKNENYYKEAFDSITEFYKFALKSMCNGNFDFITREFDYRKKLSNNFRNYFEDAYLYATRYKEKELNREVSLEIKINEISQEFTRYKLQEQKRDFSKLSSIIDNSLIDEKADKKRKILESILLDRHYLDLLKNKHQELYNMDKKELLAVLTENAYRIYNLCYNPTSKRIINLFEEKSPERYNPNVIKNIMYGFDDVVSFINNLDDYRIEKLIEFYAVTRCDNKNIYAINTSHTIYPTDETIAIYNQFEDINLIEKLDVSKRY